MHDDHPCVHSPSQVSSTNCRAGHRAETRQISCVKNQFFWAVSGCTPLGPLFLYFSYFFFIFVFFFNFFPYFSFFLCFSFVFSFFFFIFSFIFLLFSFLKNVSSFFIFSLFSFLGCSKSVVALQDSLWNSAHSGDDQVESRLWWAAGGSSPTFVPESPD